MNKIALISLIHIFILVPLLFLIYFRRKQLTNLTFNVILYSSIIILIYHIYKTIIKVNWINILHFSIIAPVLIYIGMKKEKTPYYMYELLLMIAFAGFGYHLYTLIKFL